MRYEEIGSKYIEMLLKYSVILCGLDIWKMYVYKWPKMDDF